MYRKRNFFLRISKFGKLHQLQQIIEMSLLHVAHEWTAMYFHNFAEMKLIAVNLFFTLNNIQLSKQQEQCLTESNEPCVLPFKYKVHSYTYEYRKLL